MSRDFIGDVSILTSLFPQNFEKIDGTIKCIDANPHDIMLPVTDDKIKKKVIEVAKRWAYQQSCMHLGDKVYMVSEDQMIVSDRDGGRYSVPDVRIKAYTKDDVANYTRTVQKLNQWVVDRMTSTLKKQKTGVFRKRKYTDERIRWFVPNVEQLGSTLYCAPVDKKDWLRSIPKEGRPSELSQVIAMAERKLQGLLSSSSYIPNCLKELPNATLICGQLKATRSHESLLKVFQKVVSMENIDLSIVQNLLSRLSLFCSIKDPSLLCTQKALKPYMSMLHQMQDVILSQTKSQIQQLEAAILELKAIRDTRPEAHSEAHYKALCANSSADNFLAYVSSIATTKTTKLIDPARSLYGNPACVLKLVAPAYKGPLTYRKSITVDQPTIDSIAKQIWIKRHFNGAKNVKDKLYQIAKYRDLAKEQLKRELRRYSNDVSVYQVSENNGVLTIKHLLKGDAGYEAAQTTYRAEIDGDITNAVMKRRSRLFCCSTYAKEDITGLLDRVKVVVEAPHFDSTVRDVMKLAQLEKKYGVNNESKLHYAIYKLKQLPQTPSRDALINLYKEALKRSLSLTLPEVEFSKLFGKCSIDDFVMYYSAISDDTLTRLTVEDTEEVALPPPPRISSLFQVSDIPAIRLSEIMRQYSNPAQRRLAYVLDYLENRHANGGAGEDERNGRTARYIERIKALLTNPNLFDDITLYNAIEKETDSGALVLAINAYVTKIEELLALQNLIIIPESLATLTNGSTITEKRLAYVLSLLEPRERQLMLQYKDSMLDHFNDDPRFYADLLQELNQSARIRKIREYFAKNSSTIRFAMECFYLPLDQLKQFAKPAPTPMVCRLSLLQNVLLSLGQQPGELQRKIAAAIEKLDKLITRARLVELNIDNSIIPIGDAIRDYTRSSGDCNKLLSLIEEYISDCSFLEIPQIIEDKVHMTIRVIKQYLSKLQADSVFIPPALMGLCDSCMLLGKLKPLTVKLSGGEYEPLEASEDDPYLLRQIQDYLSCIQLEKKGTAAQSSSRKPRALPQLATGSPAAASRQQSSTSKLSPVVSDIDWSAHSAGIA